MRFIALVAVVALPIAGLGRSARAGDPPKPTPLEAGKKVRAAVPEPVEDAGLAFEWKGDLVLFGETAGTARVSVDVGEYRGKPAWIATEETRQEWAGATVVTSWSFYLARDLSLLRGEASREEGDRSVRLFFVRDDPAAAALQVTREIRKGEEAEGDVVTVAASADATCGVGALLLFLRAAPKDKATYALPVAPLEEAWPTTEEHAPAKDAVPATVEVRGAGKQVTKTRARDSWIASVARGPWRFDVHLAPKDRSLLGIDYAKPLDRRWVPTGEGGAKHAYADDKPAASWREAFLKFGHGYHRADRALLEAACHWPSVLAYDVAAGSWPKDDADEAAIRTAYVKEWLERSKHRGRAETDALLAATLATATVKTLDDGTVLLTTHPEYGGNAFRFRSVGGAWFIVGIDP